MAKHAWRCSEVRATAFNFHIPSQPKTGYGWNEGDRDHCTECLRPIVYAAAEDIKGGEWAGWRWVRIHEIIEWP